MCFLCLIFKKERMVNVALRNYILIFVIILLTGFLIYASKRKLIKRGWLRRTVYGLTVTALVLMTLAVLLFPDLYSVKTTGEYSFKSLVLEVTDNTRKEEFDKKDSYRSLSLLVYYPDITEDKACPLVVFSHGGISTKTSNISLYKELASHGYVVVSIDHTYHSISTSINGKKISIDQGYLKEITSEDSHSEMESSLACFQKWMKIRTDDINFVIDYCLEETDDPVFSLIDPARIGVAGHSLGGAAALGVARQRSDIKAVIALESPFLYDITGVRGDEFEWNREDYSCALMNVYSDSAYDLVDRDHKYVQNKKYLYNEGNVEYYYIKGSNHYTLTDLVRTSPVLCMILGGGYKKGGYETLAYINQKSLAFFDKYLIADN